MFKHWQQTTHDDPPPELENQSQAIRLPTVSTLKKSESAKSSRGTAESDFPTHPQQFHHPHDKKAHKPDLQAC